MKPRRCESACQFCGNSQGSRRKISSPETKGNPVHKSTILTAILVFGFGAEAAQADTFSRSGPRMQVDRSFDGNGSATVSREFNNSATANRSTSCSGNGRAAGCSSSIDVQTQSGDAYSVERNSAATRYRAGTVTSVTGPEGNTVVSPRRWRRW